ncbi:MAG: transglycosylase domain-containing protein [Kofleriaceae bacterium]
MTTRERRILVATAILAIGAPVGALALVRDRTEALSTRLTSAAGVPSSIGAVDADLTGTVRLSDVAIGSLVIADTIEASVALETLLSGDLRADEIRIASPRVAIEIDADGDSNLARLARRLAKRPPEARPSTTAPSRSAPRAPRVRRIVVSEGTLTARIDGVGEISADGVEIVPDTHGARVITGALRVSSHGGALADVALDLAFARSAAEITLPEMKVGRVLAVAGTGTIVAAGRTTTLRDVAAGRLARTTPSSMREHAMPAPIEVHATIDDAGVPREIAVRATPTLLLVSGEHIPLAGLAGLAPHAVRLDGAHATGTVRVSGERSALVIEADGAIEGLALEHKTLAATRVPVSAAIRATAKLDSATRAPTISLERFELDTGAIRARLSGHVQRATATTPLSAQIDLAIDKARCADLLASLPAEIRGPLDGIVLDGELGLVAKLAIDLGAPAGDGVALATDFTGRCKALAEPPGADVTTLVHDGADDEDFIELSKIPSRVQGAFVSAEDGRFWDHDGFDLEQIGRSLEIDLRERRLARGGSTISQQLVKNAFLTHRRTLDRKLQEAVLTWRLEARLDKQQILERYLNLIELGPGVRGVGPAAKHWFGTTPRNLTTRQMAFLAALTSEPTSMSKRVRRRGGLDEVSAERVATILRAMRRDGVISSAEHDAARTQGMSFVPAAIRDDR